MSVSIDVRDDHNRLLGEAFLDVDDASPTPWQATVRMDARVVPLDPCATEDAAVASIVAYHDNERRIQAAEHPRRRGGESATEFTGRLLGERRDV